MKSPFAFTILLFAVKSVIGQNQYSDFIDRLNDYQSKVKLVIKKDSIYIDTNTFKIEDYLKVFNKLTPNKNYPIRYYNSYSVMGGQPVLYAFHDTTSKASFEKLFEIALIKSSRFYDSLLLKALDSTSIYKYDEAKMIEKVNREKNNTTPQQALAITVFEIESTKSYNYLTPEPSKIGYFQYLMYYLMAEKIGLYWHSNYGIKHIIASRKQMEDIIKKNKNDEYDFDASKANRLLRSNFTPKITINKKQCLITFYEFNIQGFYRMTYRIVKGENLKVEKIKSQIILVNTMKWIY